MMIEKEKIALHTSSLSILTTRQWVSVLSSIPSSTTGLLWASNLIENRSDDSQRPFQFRNSMVPRF